MLTWKMAGKLMGNHKGIYLFVFVQQTLSFFVYIIVFSVFFYFADDYLRFWEYFNRQGVYLQVGQIYDESGQYEIHDSSQLEEMFPGVEIIGGYRLNGNFQTNEDSVTISAFSYDEEIQSRLKPEMKDGLWLDEDTQTDSDSIRGVITDSIYDVQVGDEILLRGWMGDWEPITVEVVGVMKHFSDFWGYSITDDLQLDFRSCWEHASFQEPVLFLDKEEISQKLKENPDSGIGMSLYNSVLATYKEEADEEEILSFLEYLKSHGQYGIMENLSVVNDNSRSYLRQQMLQLFPAALVTLIFSVVSGVGIKVILLGLNERRWRIFRLCGCTGRQWAQIQTAAYFIADGTALLFSLGLIGGAGALLQTDFSFVVLHWSAAIFCLLVLLFDVLASWGIIRRMINHGENEEGAQE